MTQDELQCLLLKVQDEVNLISYYRHYLKISLELMNNPDDETLERVELLVETFLLHIECHLDELGAAFKYLSKSCNNKSRTATKQVK